MSGGTTIGEFAINLFVDAGKGELTVGGLVKAMGELEVASVGEIAILATLANKLLSITMHTIEGSEALKDYTAITGGSVESLQKWTSAASHVGMKGKEVEGVFRSMSHNLAMGHKTGQYGAPTNAVNFLPGVGAALRDGRADHPEDFLKFLRNSKEFQAMASFDKELVLSQMGIGIMQRALTQGPGGISNEKFKMFETESGIISKAQMEKYHEMEQALKTFENTAERIGKIISGWFSGPVLNSLNAMAATLKATADYMDAINIKKPSDKVASELEAVPGLTTIYQLDILRKKLINDWIEAAEKKMNPAGLGAPLPSSFNPTNPAPVHQHHQTQNTIKVDIHGTKLNENQLAAAIYSGVVKAFQPAVNVLNTGTVA